MTNPPLAARIRSAFAVYRAAMETARDPDEPPVVRDHAWSRAAKARARIERQLSLLEEVA